MNSRSLTKSAGHASGLSPATVDSAQLYLSGINTELESLGGKLGQQRKTKREKYAQSQELGNDFERAKAKCSADHLPKKIQNFLTNHPTEGVNVFLQHDGIKFIKSGVELDEIIASRQAQVDVLNSVKRARDLKDRERDAVDEYLTAESQEEYLNDQIDR